MTRWGLGRLLIILAISALVWAVMAAVGLLVGSTEIGWPTAQQFELRLEVVLIASIVGAALGGAGAAYQAVLRNPLAEPYLLGVSGGATLGLYVWVLPFAAAIPFLDAFSQQAFALMGALAALAVVFVLAQRRGRIEPITLILVGVIVNAIGGALFMLLQHLDVLRRAPGRPDALSFLIGGIRTYLPEGHILAAAITVGLGLLVLLALAGQLNVGRLSEAEAQSLGVRVSWLRWGALGVASLMAAASVAISGPIGFVGLVAPHLGRMIVGTDHRRLLPLSAALGAGLLVLADAISRGLATHIGLLPVGVLTGLLGGPFFLYLLWRMRRREEA